MINPTLPIAVLRFDENYRPVEESSHPQRLRNLPLKSWGEEN